MPALVCGECRTDEVGATSHTEAAESEMELLPRKRSSCWHVARLFGIRLLAAAMTFLLLGFGLGLTFYLGTDYPCFLLIAPLGPNGTRCGFRVD